MQTTWNEAAELAATGASAPVAGRRWLPALVALAASLAVLADVALNGTMKWHFTRQEALQGGVEALLLTLALAWAAHRASRRALALAAVVTALYLRRHHVDVPWLFALLSAEALLAFGRLVIRPGDEATAVDGMRRFVTGLMLWLVLMFVMHALHLAWPETLLQVFGALGAGVWLLYRRSWLIMPTLRSWRAQTPARRMLWSLPFSWMLVLMARSNVTVSFDTMWYLARGDSVLAPSGSLFDQLGLVSAVHYFPKLWETLILPLERFNDFSFPAAYALMLGALGLAACARLLRKLGTPPGLVPLCLLAIATLPAIASTALLLKTDIAAWAFMLFAVDAFADWAQQRRSQDAVWMLIGIALACSSKLTVVPYAGVLLIVAAVHALRTRRLPSPAPGRLADAAIPFALASLVAGTLLFRTWWLAGVPTIGPDPLLAIWNALGMHLRPPAGTLDWLRPQDWHDAPRLLPEALFAPNGLPQLRISWTGNVWLLAALFAWAWRGRRPPAPPTARSLRGFLLLTAATGLALLIGWAYHTRGSDGNYFIVPVTAASLLAFAAMGRNAGDRNERIGMAWMLCVCATWQAAFGFVSAGWSQPGTRRLDLDLLRSPIDGKAFVAAQLRGSGLDAVQAQLAPLPRWTRTLVVGPSEAGHYLSTRVESLEHVSYSRPEFTSSPEALAGYLRSACIERIVLMAEPPAPAILHARTEDALRLVPHQVLVSGPRAELVAVDLCHFTDGRGFERAAVREGR